MSVEWEIGEEAKELDEKPILERVKIKRRSVISIAGALLIYFLTMTLFYFFL